MSLFYRFAVDKQHGEVLNLSRVSRADMGSYLCIASNGVPPSVSKRIVLDVECKCDIEKITTIFRKSSKHITNTERVENKVKRAFTRDRKPSNQNMTCYYINAFKIFF